MGVSSRHRCFLACQLNATPPPAQTQSYIQQKGPTVSRCLAVSKKTGLQANISPPKFVFRHNNIKPKKAKSFLDIAVKNDANGISNKLDKFYCNYVIIQTSISAAIYGIHVTSYLTFIR